MCRQETKYRIKPRTVTRTITYPEPLREKPERGNVYWTIYDPASREATRSLTWEDDQFDERLFQHGMCFATMVDARAAYVALFGGE